MHRVALPLFLACLIASAIFVMAVASCDLGPPEPDCEPPEPEQCTYKGEVIWTGPLCVFYCEDTYDKDDNATI